LNNWDNWSEQLKKEAIKQKRRELEEGVKRGLSPESGLLQQKYQQIDLELDDLLNKLAEREQQIQENSETEYIPKQSNYLGLVQQLPQYISTAKTIFPWVAKGIPALASTPILPLALALGIRKLLSQHQTGRKILKYSGMDLGKKLLKKIF